MTMTDNEILLLPVIGSSRTTSRPKMKQNSHYDHSEEELRVLMIFFFSFVVIVALIFVTIGLYTFLIHTYVDNNPPLLDVELLGPEQIYETAHITAGTWKHSQIPFIHLNFPIEIRLKKSNLWPLLDIKSGSIEFKSDSESTGKTHLKNMTLTDDITSQKLVADLHNEGETAKFCNSATTALRRVIRGNIKITHRFWLVLIDHNFEKELSICCSSDETCGR